MDPSLPVATAIAVRDGRVVEVGSLESLEPWLRHHPHEIDGRFESSVILPGLIDPHVHPAMMSLLMAAEWLTPEPWELPGRSIPSTEGRQAYLAGVQRLEAQVAGGVDAPLVVFGYHTQFHGDILRVDLDAISSTRPIVLWQRSFHELRCNGPGLAWLDAAEGAAWDPHIELETGRLFESGMVWGLKTLSPFLLGEGKLEKNLRDFRSLVRAGGVTTLADAGYGIIDFEMELSALEQEIDRDSTPFRLLLMPNVPQAKSQFRDDLFERLEAFRARETHRLRFLRAAKFFADGAFIAQLMQVGPPGFIDGHQGAWLAEPERMLKLIRPFWEARLDIHIHANGDLGVGACLDTVETLLHESPRFDHRTTIHHFGLSTQAQSRRMAALGVGVQANGYYLHMFGDRFVDEWLGTERASQMTRLGSAVRNGVSAAVHSDVPMGPVLPLLAASSHATRTTRGGRVMAPSEALTPAQALAAVTIEPAFQLRWDHEVGSLAAGKLADLCIVDTDPFAVPPAEWPEIKIEATALEGQIFD